ncbi:class I adenylate cyclase [Shewanella sp. Isolate11]|uniref:class I adenylate cyclase n=1 Tax=Shewanella sp. Isolate11 TaxID=2908530 RepID=UPI001EFD0B73|nr:class I adenylate cyclase [Shewanella sp. Isolate11]MCG9695427.1 class I adenylate cyclase [Shewanella sp. Isolate11]
MITLSEQEHFIETAERLNRIRLARAQAILTPLQRHLFTLIPLLFHYHRSGYPGYNSPMTPSGVVDYVADSKATEACNILRLDPPSATNSQQQAILGVYSMGSTATFGQNPRSDIDVWVIYDAELTRGEVIALQQKSNLLTSWFEQHDLEVNIYLVHPKQFLAADGDCDDLGSSMGCENSGSAQHWLLLEEFYRSHICLAGKPIAWWPEAATPATHLFLGDVRNLAASEYFGASLWQLYKGLDKPHKALLKVLLLEAYASSYPNTELVSSQVWQCTLEGDFSAFNDAYYLLYQSIERYLEQKNDLRRLEIIRRCFYLKCGIRLTATDHPQDWRYFKLRHLVERWGWSDNLLSTLDKCADWHCGQLQWFNEQLNELMLGSYQTLLHFAAENKLSEKLKISELGLLTRKLHTYFSDDDNQIISLNRLWSHSIAEAYLTVIYSHNTEEFYLYRCQPEPKNFIGNRAVFHSRSKAKLLVWATLNGVSTATTQWYDFGGKTARTKQLTKAARRLPYLLQHNDWCPSKLNLCQPWHFKKLVVLINFNSDPTDAWQGQEIMIDYINANVFSLGSQKKNMLQSLDVICQNSWGEWHCHHFDGEEAILNALVYITPGMQRAQDKVQVDVVSCSTRLSTQFERAVKQLIDRANVLSIKAQSSSTMVHPLQVGKVRYGLFFNSKGMIYQDLSDANAFYQKLSKKQVLELPRPDLGNDPFSKIPQVIQEYAAIGAVQYFLRQRPEGIDVFVLDEHNEVNHYVQPGNNLEELVSQVSHHHAFSESYLEKQRFNLPQFFRLIRVEGKLQAQPFGVNVDEAATEF